MQIFSIVWENYVSIFRIMPYNSTVVKNELVSYSISPGKSMENIYVRVVSIKKIKTHINIENFFISENVGVQHLQSTVELTFSRSIIIQQI